MEIKKGIMIVLLTVCVVSIASFLVLYFLEHYYYSGEKYEVYFTESFGMEPTIMRGDYVLVDKLVNVEDIIAGPYPDGDIIAFRRGRGTIIHRAIEKELDGDRIKFTTKGDWNRFVDAEPVYEENVIGEAVDVNFILPKIWLHKFLILIVTIITGTLGLILYFMIRGEKPSSTSSFRTYDLRH